MCVKVHFYLDFVVTDFNFFPCKISIANVISVCLKICQWELRDNVKQLPTIDNDLNIILVIKLFVVICLSRL